MRTFHSLMAGLLLVCSPIMGQTKLDKSIKLFNEGQYDPAKTILQEVVRDDPRSASAFYYLGLITMDYDYEQSIEYLESAVKLDYTNSRYHVVLGNAYGMKAARAGIFSKLGAAGNCLKQFKLAAQFDPKNLDARTGLIEYYLQAPGIVGGSVDKAEAEVDTVKSFDLSRGYLEEALVYQYEKKPADQEECYRKAISEDPKSLSAYRSLLWFYWTNKKFDKADQLFSKALAAVEQKSELYYSAGIAYLNANNFTKAVTMFNAALKEDSTKVSAYYRLGRCVLLSGSNLQQGLVYFDKYLQHEPPNTGPSWPYAHWQKGMIYEKLGDKDAAMKEYREALRMNSHLQEAKRALDGLK